MNINVATQLLTHNKTYASGEEQLLFEMEVIILYVTLYKCLILN